MKKTFIFASLITIIVLIPAYLGYIPSYICAIISMCVFIIAISSSVCSAIRSSITDIKETQQTCNENILRLFENLNENMGKIEHALEDNKNSAALQMETVHSVLEQSHATLEAISCLISKSIQDLSVKLDEQLKTIGEKNDSISNAVNANSTEVEKLSAAIAPLRKEIQESTEKIKTSSNQNADNFSKVIDSVTNCLSQQIECVVAKITSLNDSIKEYTTSTISVQETNTTLSADISKAIKLVNDSVSTMSRENRRIIGDLGNVTSENIEKLCKELTNTTNAQTESLSDSEDKIRKSIEKLCNNLTEVLRLIEVDFDEICKSVQDMKNLSQSIEQSDKDLLSRIIKTCK